MNENILKDEKFDIKKKRISILENYGENFNDKDYITNPAIGRDEQIKQLILILLTPDKSAVLTLDDGEVSNYTIAYPLSVQYKIPLVQYWN